MNVKGLKLNKALAVKILSSYDSISLSNLHGIEAFHSFSWIGFSREEFRNLLSLTHFLVESNCFTSIPNSYPFVFNYSTDITEMDIVSVFSDNKQPVFIDLETKNGDDYSHLCDKINEQIDKRVDDYLPQLIKNNKYLVAGFVNNTFVRAVYFDGESPLQIDTFSGFKSLIKGFKKYEEMEEYLVQSSNLASIVKVCSDIRSGSFKYYEGTNKVYNSIVSKIDNNDVSIVYGNAGTGKSILALRLLFELTNTKILLINSKLYYSLNMWGMYSSGRATFNSTAFLNSIDENTISIVDECQRLPIETMVTIIRKSKHTFLFGDNKQAFTKRCTLLNSKELAKLLKNDYGFNVSQRVIKKTRRYSEEADKAITMLTSLEIETKDMKLSSDYSINLFYDEKEFIKTYDSMIGIKKMYCPLDDSSAQNTIGGRVFTKASYNDDKFSIWPGGADYYGTVYHALSFDIDHSFVFLRNTEMTTFDKKRVLFHSKYYGEVTFDSIQIYSNELNILFTRGRKSLNICVNDIETYLYFNRLINKLK